MERNKIEYILFEEQPRDKLKNAGMAELADAHGSGPCDSNIMRVQVSFPARLRRKLWLSSFLFHILFCLNLFKKIIFLLTFIFLSDNISLAAVNRDAEVSELADEQD